MELLSSLYQNLIDFRFQTVQPIDGPKMMSKSFTMIQNENRMHSQQQNFNRNGFSSMFKTDYFFCLYNQFRICISGENVHSYTNNGLIL